MAQHNDTGREGEMYARTYLEKQNYKIRACNWRYGKGELDIIAEKDGMIIVVEVKSRSTLYFEHPKDSINTGKIKRIVATTHEYILSHALDMDVRFDVISVYPEGQTFRIEHIEDAFSAPVH
ncbi:MAG: YraN family protein [Prevotellaceae bacterium]|jgi:putative endonuclease|nr:YraN family protein [Prevotellaceae bacterium]